MNRFTFTTLKPPHFKPFPGKPRREVSAGQTAATFDPRKCRFTHGFGQLLQGRAPRPRHHSRGVASPEAAGEHLAAPQSAPAPASAAVCLSAGRSAGERQRICFGAPAQGSDLDTTSEAKGGSVRFSLHAAAVWVLEISFPERNVESNLCNDARIPGL